MNKLCDKTIKDIESMLKIGKSRREIRKELNVSVSSVRKICLKQYPKYYLDENRLIKFNPIMRHDNIITTFFKKKHKMINEIYKITNHNKELIIYTDCYSTKFREYKVIFLVQNHDVFYFRNLNNNRILCFKFGDFMAHNIKVVHYE